MVVYYQTNKPAGCIRDTEETRSHIGLQSRKCHNCKLWCEEAEKVTEETMLLSMVLKVTVNDMRHLALCLDEFRGPMKTIFLMK
ncbi:hypothetical protein TNCV_316701 [Trichonephila clavipes]|nr:hypothetical protein TNCV_316701 [Trichonephila clavipes]